MSALNDELLWDRDLDLANATRGVWLVKVPKYIANKWQNAPDNFDVGKLEISRSLGHRPQVKLLLSEAILNLDEEEEREVAKEHLLDVSNISRQTLGVFAQSPLDTDDVVPKTEKLYMEGRIVQELKCRPLGNKAYYRLKSDLIKKASIPQRKAKQLTGIVQTYKPVSRHPHNITKASEGKKSRDDKEVVLNILFAAFEKHQYYNIKDLHMITRQPMQFLKEVLLEICKYNSKNPHKGMWELKPEYSHYEQQRPVETNEDINDTDSD